MMQAVLYFITKLLQIKKKTDSPTCDSLAGFLISCCSAVEHPAAKSCSPSKIFVYFTVMFSNLYHNNVELNMYFSFSFRESLWFREVLGVPQILQSEFVDFFSQFLFVHPGWIFL